MRYGGIGEIEVFKYCKSKGLHAKLSERFDAKYDLLVENKKVDVKTRCGKVPLDGSFYLNVQAEHASSDKDVIIFCYLNETNGDIQVLGGLTLPEFLHEAKLKRLGDTEPNGFAYHCDTYVIAVNQLKSLENTLKSGATVAPLSGKSGVTFGEKSTTFSKKSTTMAPLSGKRAPLSGGF